MLFRSVQGAIYYANESGLFTPGTTLAPFGDILMGRALNNEDLVVMGPLIDF